MFPSLAVDPRGVSPESKHFRYLHGLVDAGIVTQSNLQEWFDSLIARKVVPRLTRAQLENAYATWGDLYPEHGRELVNALQPLFAPNQRFMLRPPCEQIVVLAQMAVFWRAGHFNDVYIVTPNTLPEFYGHPMCRNAFSTEESKKLWCGALGQSFPRDPSTHISTARATLDQEIYSRLGPQYAVERMIHNLSGPLGIDSPGGLFVSHLAHSLLETILHAASFVLEGRSLKARLFDPAFALWFMGNPPIGFDDENNLLVFCAD